MPAECFHVSEFIQEELDARGWTIRDLAERMGGDPVVDEYGLQILFACAKHPKHSVGLRLREDGAAGLAKAFGMEAQTWLNLEAAYIEWRRVQNN